MLRASPRASPNGSPTLKHKQLKVVQAAVVNESKLSVEALQTPQNKHKRQKSAPSVKRKIRESKKRPPPVDVSVSRALFQSREGSTLTTPEEGGPLHRKDSMEIKVTAPSNPTKEGLVSGSFPNTVSGSFPNAVSGSFPSGTNRAPSPDKELEPILAEFCKFTCQRVSNDQVLIDVVGLHTFLQGCVPEFMKSYDK